MLFKMAVLERVARGEVTLAFRRWKRPTVKAGGTLRTALGVLAIEEVAAVEPGAITAKQAALAGAPSLEALRAALARGEGEIYRIKFKLAGEDPRIALRKSAALSAEDVTRIDARLAALDARAEPPWTMRALKRIGEAEGEVSTALAKRLKMDRAKLKIELRKIKELGLTESLEVGYRLSPRGKAYLKKRG